MQRLLQLPGTVLRPGAREETQEEAASPVLGPDGGPPPWYQALKPEELRWLQAPEEDTTPETLVEEPCPEVGQGQTQSQPLRYRVTIQRAEKAREWVAATVRPDASCFGSSDRGAWRCSVSRLGGLQGEVTGHWRV